MRFILLTGLSGAGKTTSLRHLEDLGCPYVDNLPPAMAMRFIELWSGQEGTHPVVLAADIRSQGLFDAFALEKMIAAIRENGTDLRVLFLESDDQTLLNRFKETRKEHPLSAQTGGSLSAAIMAERERMQPLRETADIVIDTTGIRPAQLREKINEQLFQDEDAKPRIRTEIVSFGFKRGIIRDADLLLDVRFLPNPFYVNSIRLQTGLQSGVQEFVLGAPVTKEFLEKETDLLSFLLPNYEREGKRRLIVGVGCTGGAHRSVAIAEELGKRLRALGFVVSVRHRDIELEQENWKRQ